MAVKFDFSGIDQGATVNSAKLRFNKHGNYSGYAIASTYTAHTLTTDWAETSVSWDSPWSNAGGDFSQTAIDSYDYNGSFNGWIEFTLTEIVQSMINGTSDNFGFIIADLNGDDGSSASLDQESYIYSKEASDQSTRIQLVVDYDVTEIVTEAPGKSTLNIKNLKVSGKNVIFNSPSDQTISLSLYSATGRLVFNKTDLLLKTGQNSFSLLTSLSKGVYILKFYNSKNSEIYKFLSITP